MKLDFDAFFDLTTEEELIEYRDDLCKQGIELCRCWFPVMRLSDGSTVKFLDLYYKMPSWRYGKTTKEIIWEIKYITREEMLLIRLS